MSLLAIVLWLSFAIACGAQSYPPQLFSPLIPSKVFQTANTLQTSQYTYPQYTDSTQGKWQFFPPDTWTSGFFPATLYAMNTRMQLCGSANGLDQDWISLARAWDSGEMPLETTTTVGHDVGFLSFPFIEELAINPTNQTAVDAVNAFANDLAARFNPIVGCTRSWDSADPTDFQVIIDNMMNLEVLFISAGLTGNSTLQDIAMSHADKTMQNHIRADGSSFHVVDYNSTTGQVIRQRTQQGYSDNSTWSRGQAWGIYGFANMYKFTNQTRYLETSRLMASYLLTQFSLDGVIPWDFNAPSPRPADSSAATISASGLLLLAQQETAVGNSQYANMWINAAYEILSNITALAWQPSWQSLLSNGTVNYPGGNVNTGIVYGDYYFIQAGNQIVSMKLSSCT